VNNANIFRKVKKTVKIQKMWIILICSGLGSIKS